MKLGWIVPAAVWFVCAVCRAQTPDAPPKDVEEALRARVDQFYQNNVNGKLRQSLALVADDSLDRFLQQGSSKFEACENVKITFSADFTKAEAVEKCKGDIRFHGLEQHPTFAVSSRWKLVDGQWFWYWAKPDTVDTPFGPSKYPDENPAGGAAAGTAPPMPDARKLADGMYQSVKLDRNSVNLSTSGTSQDAIYITNGLPGGISLSLPTTSQPGLKIMADKLDLAGGDKTRIVFKYDVNDPAIACMDCLKKLHGPVMTEVRIIPTGQVLRISINFVNDGK
jgi:hypothetical protein